MIANHAVRQAVATTAASVFAMLSAWVTNAEAAPVSYLASLALPSDSSTLIFGTTGRAPYLLFNGFDSALGTLTGVELITSSFVFGNLFANNSGATIVNSSGFDIGVTARQQLYIAQSRLVFDIDGRIPNLLFNDRCHVARGQPFYAGTSDSFCAWQGSDARTTALAVTSAYTDQTVQLINDNPALLFSPELSMAGVSYAGDATMRMSYGLRYTYDDAVLLPPEPAGVPAPGTLPLVALALVGIGFSRRASQSTSSRRLAQRATAGLTSEASSAGHQTWSADSAQSPRTGG